MGKFLKQGYVRKLEWEHSRGAISRSKMIELIEQKCINNYKVDVRDKLNFIDDFLARCEDSMHSEEGKEVTMCRKYIKELQK